MKVINRNPLITAAGLICGTAGGFLYYHYVGCRTGSCAITSNPWLSMVWGAALGYLVSDLFKRKKPSEIKSTDLDKG